jgi:hypothetical protein
LDYVEAVWQLACGDLDPGRWADAFLEARHVAGGGLRGRRSRPLGRDVVGLAEGLRHLAQRLAPADLLAGLGHKPRRLGHQLGRPPEEEVSLGRGGAAAVRCRA